MTVTANMERPAVMDSSSCQGLERALFGITRSVFAPDNMIDFSVANGRHMRERLMLKWEITFEKQAAGVPRSNPGLSQHKA